MLSGLAYLAPVGVGTRRIPFTAPGGAGERTGGELVPDSSVTGAGENRVVLFQGLDPIALPLVPLGPCEGALPGLSICDASHCKKSLDDHDVRCGRPAARRKLLMLGCELTLLVRLARVGP